MNPIVRTVYVLFIVLLAAFLVAGCSKSSSPTSPGQKVTNLAAGGSFAPVSRTQVTGTLIVVDQSNQPISNLGASNITPILSWVAGTLDSATGSVLLQNVSASGKKVAVAMTMDYSGSMFYGAMDSVTGKYQRILDMESGVKTFVRAMRTGDAAEIIKFGDNASVIQPFTTNQALLLKAADSLSYDWGYTALYQSIYLGLTDAGAVSGTSYARAIIAFTDGGENNSIVNRAQVLALSRTLSIPVYTIGLLDSSSHSVPPGQYSYSELDLAQIADSTGGFYFYAPTATQLSSIYSTISGQLSSAYVVTITFPSTGLPASGTPVTLTIRIKYNNLTTVLTRTYIMP